VGDTPSLIRLAVGALFGSALGIFIFPVITSWVGGLRLRRWEQKIIIRYLFFLSFLVLISFLSRLDLSLLFYIFFIGSGFGLIFAYLSINVVILAWIFRVRGASEMGPKLAIIIAALFAFIGEIFLQRWWHIWWQAG